MTTNLSEVLKSSGIRPSPQRMAVFEFVRVSREHPTVDAVFAALRSRMPTLSRTTVYSTMRQLAEKRLVLSLKAEGGELRYDGDVAPHAHFKCRVCGGFYDVPYAAGCAGGFAALPRGFEADDEQLVYYGRCGRCSKGGVPRGRCNHQKKETRP